MSTPVSVGPDAELQRPPRIHVRRLSWWVWGAVLVFGIVWFVHFLVTTPGFQWHIVADYLFAPAILSGVGNTMLLTVISAITGLLAGGVVAFLRMSKNPALQIVGTAFIWLMRAIPALVVMLFIYFLGALVPRLSVGIPFTDIVFLSVPTNSVIDKFTAALIALTLIQAAYVGEIYRGGIIGVAGTQREAALALGMDAKLSMRRIIMPQAVRVIIPPLSNELITLFKNTSLVSIIGFTELLTSVQLVYGRTYQTIPLLLVACLWYLVLTTVAMLIQSQIEKRASRGFERRSRVKAKGHIA